MAKKTETANPPSNNHIASPASAQVKRSPQPAEASNAQRSAAEPTIPAQAASQTEISKELPRVTATEASTQNASARRAAVPKATKPATKKAPKKSAASGATPASTPAAAPEISHDDIALRAYLISEKRQQEGRPGSEHEDWVEAERQLKAEREQQETAPAKKSRSKKSIAL